MPTNVPYLKYAQSRSLGDVLSLPESERAKRLNYWEKLGLISPQKDGILTETLEGLADSSLSVAQGFGATLAEAGLGSGVEDYFNSVRARHRDIEPYEGYKAASWDPVSWGRTFGNALGTTIPSGVAGMAATAATGNPGIGGYVSVATMASHMWGDKVREYREAMPELGEGAVKGLALFETLGEAFIENYGPLDVAKAARNAIAGSVKKASQEAIEGTVRKFGRKAVWDFLKKAGEGGIGEGGEEIAQTYWDMLCRRIGGDTKTPMPDWEQIKEEFMGGFIGGVGLGGGEAALEAGLDASRRYREVEPRDNKIKLPEPNKNGIKLPVPQEYDEDRQRHLSDDFIQYMAGHIGVKVREATAEEVRAKEQEATAKRGKELDGLVIPGWRERGSDTVVLNTKAGTEGMARAFGHEVKHWMDENHPELTKKFDTLLDTLMNSRGKAALQEAAERWGDAGNAREEFFCDVFGELVENPNAMDSLARSWRRRRRGLAGNSPRRSRSSSR